MRYALALIWLVACKQAGTVSISFEDPCGETAVQIGAFLHKALSCEPFVGPPAPDGTEPSRPQCPLPKLACVEPDCRSGCDGVYCAPEDISGVSIDPPESGEYALVLRFRYGTRDTPEPIDRGVACYFFQVEADGTSNKSFDASAARRACCVL